MKANRMQKPIAKAERSAGLRQWPTVAANGDCAADHRMHGLDARNGEINQYRAGKVEQCKEIEIRRQPHAVDHGGGYQPPDQIAGDVAGDVGRERAARVHRTALLAEIGQRQRKRRCHAEALRDAQRGKHHQIRCARQQRGGDREQDQAQQNAEPAVDMRAQEADNEAGDRHAERAGVDRKAHLGRRHVVMPGQRRKDRLRGEQVDHGQEGREADDERAQHHAGRGAMHFHRFGHVGHGASRGRPEKRKDVTPGRVGRHGGPQGVTSGNETSDGARYMLWSCGSLRTSPT